ncbi:MAG TPA: DUF559 domain-containing protein [Burkholderiales bacterium]|nr:DUF559 domain-containing protein [Burkholderiales bacterium]
MRHRRLVPYHLQLKDASRRLPLGSYIADFYCSQLRLVIEVDGDSRVIRFTNADVMQRFEAVCERIARVLVET